MNTLRLFLTKCLGPTWMEICFSVFKFDSCSTQLHILSEAGGSPEQTIAGISFLCCSLGHCFFQLCVLSLPFLVLLQLAFPGVLLGSPESPWWPFCLDFWVSFNFTTHSSLVICFERTYNLIFWKHLPLAFFSLPLSSHDLRMCCSHALGWKSACNFYSDSWDLPDHSLCEVHPRSRPCSMLLWGSLADQVGYVSFLLSIWVLDVLFDPWNAFFIL